MVMIIVRLCIAVLGVALSLGLVRAQRKVTSCIIASYFALRLLGIAFLIFVLKVPYPGDLPWFMQFLSEGFREGTFHRWYGSLFCFMIGGLSCAIPSPFALIALFSVFEVVGAFLIWKALGRLVSRSFSDACLWLYMLNPIVLQGVWLSGQDEAIQVFCVGVLLWLFDSSKQILLPALGGVLLHLTKPQSLWLIGAFLVTGNLLDWTVFGVVSAGIIGLGMMTGLHYYELAGLGGQVIVPSGNVCFFSEKVFGQTLNGTCVLVVIGVLFLIEAIFCMGGAAKGERKNDLLATAFASVLFGLTFALLSPFVFPSYITYAIPFLALLLVAAHASKRAWSAYALWSVAYSMDATLNYRVFQSIPKGNELSPAGALWAALILALHVWLLVEVLAIARQKGFSLRKGLHQFWPRFAWHHLCPAFKQSGRADVS